MTEVRFYHLTRKRLEQALPELLEKTLQRGWQAVVLTGSSERAEALAQQLWTYRTDSFLPHGTQKDGQPAQQPIWITPDDERPNDAEVLFLTDGATSAHINAFSLVCDLFDGNDEDAVMAARQRWKSLKTENHELSYWQQSDAGWNKEV